MLRQIRARAQRNFDGRFFEKSERFSPLAPAARCFAGYEEWPSIEAIDEALSPRANVRFVAAARRPRRQRGPVDLQNLYDAHIVRGEVPTRARDWHDFLNALVWATFPLAKAALHARQNAAVQAWAREHGTMIDDHRVAKLPGARTRELDALALLDEGGVLLLRNDRSEMKIVFGHAHYEGIVLGVPAMIGRAVVLEARDVAAADAAFAQRLTGSLAPEDLPRASW